MLLLLIVKTTTLETIKTNTFRISNNHTTVILKDTPNHHFEAVADTSLNEAIEISLGLQITGAAIVGEVDTTTIFNGVQKEEVHRPEISLREPILFKPHRACHKRPRKNSSILHKRRRVLSDHLRRHRRRTR